MVEENVIVAVLGVIGIFIIPALATAYLLYFLLKTRNEERMELIKQGIIPSQRMKATPNKFLALRNGCLFIGLAIGLVVGMIVDYAIEYSDMGSFLIMLSSSILFLGIGYMTFYFLAKDKRVEEE